MGQQAASYRDVFSVPDTLMTLPGEVEESNYIPSSSSFCEEESLEGNELDLTMPDGTQEDMFVFL